MKQFKPYVIIVSLLIILVVPVVVYASWWNPFSWHWNNIFKVFSKPQTITVQQKQNVNQQQIQNQQQTTQNQNAQDETANWKTYTNTQYGFEIKYPKDWYLKEVLNSIEFRTYSDNDILKPQDSLIPIVFEKSSSIDNWINQFKTGLGDTKSLGVFFQKKITVSSENGYEIGLIDPKTNSKGFTSVVLFKKGVVFIISQPSPINCQGLECKIFNQMLSTFKFIDRQTTNSSQVISPNQRVKTSKDIQAEGFMDSIAFAAELYYNKNGTYLNLGSDSDFLKVRKIIYSAIGNWTGDIFSRDAYCVDIVLTDGKTRYCIDSAGRSGENLGCSNTQLECISY